MKPRGCKIYKFSKSIRLNFIYMIIKLMKSIHEMYFYTKLQHIFHWGLPRITSILHVTCKFPLVMHTWYLQMFVWYKNTRHVFVKHGCPHRREQSLLNLSCYRNSSFEYPSILLFSSLVPILHRVWWTTLMFMLPTSLKVCEKELLLLWI